MKEGREGEVATGEYALWLELSSQRKAKELLLKR